MEYLKETVPKRLRKPKIGQNYALKSGSGPHKTIKRPQNQLFKQINDEIEVDDDLKEVNNGRKL